MENNGSTPEKAELFLENLSTKPSNFTGMSREWVVLTDMPCIRCHGVFVLPFAHGDERFVLCEPCRDAEAEPVNTPQGRYPKNRGWWRKRK